jgi:hypothetical protein
MNISKRHRSTFGSSQDTAIANNWVSKSPLLIVAICGIAEIPEHERFSQCV